MVIARSVFKIAASLSLLSAVLLPSTVQGEVRFAKLLADHAVLQRDRPIHVWGWADAGETVKVSFAQQHSEAKADDIGHWSVWLLPMPAGGPYTLTAEGSSKAVANDVYMGDVWLASGQSNMQMPLRGFLPDNPINNSAEEIKHANLPNVRLLKVGKKASTFPVNDITGDWKLCTPDTAPWISAAGYFFAREIAEKEHVMVGLIDSTWGGTPAESWTSVDGMAAAGIGTDVLRVRAIEAAKVTNRDDEDARYKRLAAAAVARGQKPPVKPWTLEEEGMELGGIYNGMIAPLTPYAIKGVIWYQGEANTSPERAAYYGPLFAGMIRDWRAKWNEGNFPFLFVQLTSFASVPPGWQVIQDIQRRTLAVANTGMAVALDVGSATTVHPPDKQSVGHRLALNARALVYGEGGLEYAGPLYRQVTPETHALRVWFDHADQMHARSGDVKGFDIAGADGVYRPAIATIEGTSVVVSSKDVAEPVKVRYGGTALTGMNLVNGSDLPAAAFISDGGLPIAK